MSVQPYPINLTSIFNKNSFEYNTDSSVGSTGNYLTVEEGLGYFLSYPVSQGGEQINGILTVNDYLVVNKTNESTPSFSSSDVGTVISYNYNSSNGYSNFINLSGASGATGGFQFLQKNSSSDLPNSVLLIDSIGNLSCNSINGYTGATGGFSIGNNSSSGTLTIGNINSQANINSSQVNVSNSLYASSLNSNILNATTSSLNIGDYTNNTINIGASINVYQPINIGTHVGATGSISIGSSAKSLIINSSNLTLDSSGNLTVSSYLNSSGIACTNIDGGSSGNLVLGGETENEINIGATVETTQPINIGTSTVSSGLITIGSSTRALDITASQTNLSNNLIMNTTGSYIQFSDNTQQTTAYTGVSSSFNLESISTADSTWIFQLNDASNDLLYGSFFDYVIYTTQVAQQNYTFNFTSSETTNTGEQSQIGYINTYSAPNTLTSPVNANYFYAYGTGIGLQCGFSITVSSSYTGTSQNYSFSNTMYSYYCDIINSNGNTITLRNYVQGYDITNNGTTAPSVNTYPTNYLAVSIANSLPSKQPLYMNIIKRFTGFTNGLNPQ